MSQKGNIVALLLVTIQIIFYTLSYLPKAGIYLAITPGRILPANFWIWTIVTFSFFNSHVIHLLSDLMTVFLVRKLLTFYNGTELLKFCAVVNLTSALLTIILLYIRYTITFDTGLLFSTQISGCIALLGGVTVVGRQMMGDKLLVNFPLGKVRYKHIPFISIMGLIPFTFFKILNKLSLTMYVFGIVVAWIYLRFYQRHSNGTIGDEADTFTFSG